VIIGVGSGLGAVLFRRMITLFPTLSFTSFAHLTDVFRPVNLVFVPVLGALIFGPMIWLWAQETRGHGVHEVMEAVALKGGRIRPQVAVVKALASAINIGSGGSVGREGPIAQIGSALGSALGQLFRLPPRYVRLLVAAGAAGGISATFNAPIAGALFGMEVILGEFSSETFAAVGTGAVVADIVAIPFLGTKPFFPLPAGVGLHSPWELVFYAALGLIGALAGSYFTRALYWTEDRMLQIPLHEALRPAAGAILVGVVITALPSVRGLGYGVMAQVFMGALPVAAILMDFVGKWVATSLTLGSGGSGGIFTPTLYMGTMIGSLFGLLMGHVFPHVSGPAAGYAMVGAAAVFTAASRAPLTAVLIVMEMSQNYVLAIPLVLTCLIANRAAGLFLQDSIYTLKLARRGVKIIREQTVDILEQITVKTAMVPSPGTISPAASLVEAAERLSHDHLHALPVVDGAGRLQGILTVSDLESAHEDVEAPLTVGDVMVRDLIVAYPDEALRTVLKRISEAAVEQLVVVDPERPSELLGVIRRIDIIRSLERQLGESPRQEAFDELPSSASRRGDSLEVELPHASPLAHRALKEIRFPEGSVVVAVRRGGKTLVPRGDTVLIPGDRILLYVVPAARRGELRRFVLEGDTGPMAADHA